MAWIIEHISEKDDNDLPLVWSNSEGFTSGDDYETFDEEEKEKYNLPIDGKWQYVAWKKEG